MWRISTCNPMSATQRVSLLLVGMPLHIRAYGGLSFCFMYSMAMNISFIIPCTECSLTKALYTSSRSLKPIQRNKVGHRMRGHCYFLTYLLTYLPTHLPTYLPTYLLTYLLSPVAPRRRIGRPQSSAIQYDLGLV